MTIKNMHLRKCPAKSTWICCEGADGHSHEHNNWIQPALAGNLSGSFRFPRFPCQFLATGCSFLLGPLSLPLQDLLDGVLQALVDEVLGLLTLTLHIKQLSVLLSHSCERGRGGVQEDGCLAFL